MAARLNKLHQEDIRKKIQASQLVNRLQDHVLGKVDLSSTQIKCAEILLRKSVSDLSAIELTGPDGGSVKFEVSAPWLKQSIQTRNSA